MSAVTDSVPEQRRPDHMITTWHTQAMLVTYSRTTTNHVKQPRQATVYTDEVPESSWRCDTDLGSRSSVAWQTWSRARCRTWDTWTRSAAADRPCASSTARRASPGVECEDTRHKFLASQLSWTEWFPASSVVVELQLCSPDHHCQPAYCLLPHRPTTKMIRRPSCDS